MADEIQVTVKRPRGTLGPMSLEALANFVAEGKVSPTDLISDGGPWVRVEDYVVREADRPDDRAAVVDDLFHDDFAIELEAPRAAASNTGTTGKATPKDKALTAPKPPASKSPSLKPPPPAAPRPSIPDVDEDDIIELLAADAPDDDDEIIDLELMDEEEPNPKAQTKPASAASVTTDKSLAVRPPPAGAATTVKPSPSKATTSAAKKPSIRPMPLPTSPAGKAGGTAPPNEALTPNLPPGFRPLLNGRNLSGWEFFPLEDWTNGRSDAWSIVDGVLQFDGKLKRPHLLTIPVFGDFEIFFAWRSRDDKGRGGLILRADGAETDAATHIVIGGPDAGRLQGRGVSGSKPMPSLQKRAGEWNVWRIVAQGGQVRLWCNQEPAWSNGRIAAMKGKLGLRAEGTPMDYKFLHVKESGPRAE